MKVKMIVSILGVASQAAVQVCRKRGLYQYGNEPGAEYGVGFGATHVDVE